MDMYRASARVRQIGILSLILGILAAGFYWWVPTGIILGLAGTTLGFVGWSYAGRHTTALPWLVVGMLVSLAALALDFAIAAMDLEVIRLHAFR
jgi:hypothetical protein